MSGKGDTPEQKVNEAVKKLKYHNILVVIAVGNKTINNIGSICTMAGKWGLSYCIIQRAILGIKEHRQGGRQYDKITRCLQRRSRHKQDESQAQDKLDQEGPPIKSPRLARERVLGKHQERRFKRRKQKEKAVVVMSYPTYHYEE